MSGSAARDRTVFGCVRRVREGSISYDLVLPAARLLGAQPLLDHEVDTVEGCPADGFRVSVSSCLIFDPLDERRGFGIVTIPRGVRMGFEGLPEIRHGMVRVTLIASLPETVWRLDEPVLPAAA